MKLNALAVVLALNLAVAAALVVLWSDTDRSHWLQPEPLPPSLDDVAVTAPTEPVEVSRYRETLERPLFTLSRRIGPRSSSGAEGQQAADPLKDIRLLGTYGAGGRGGVVVVRAGKVERFAVGSSIGDWKVAGEEGRGAVLVRASGERRKLELALNTAAPSAPASASKAGEQGAVPAPAGEQGAAPAPAAERTRTPAAASTRTTPRAAAGLDATQSDEARENLRRKRLERINARRAQSGLPPLTE